MSSNRLAIFILSTILGIVLCIPSFTNLDFFSKIKLGLDLQGGAHLTLAVKTDEAVEAKLKNIALSMKYYADKNDVLIDDLKINKDNISFTLLDKDSSKKIDEFFSKEQGFALSYNADIATATLKPQEIEHIKTQAVAQTVETIRNRLDQFGLAEPSVTKSGINDIVVELPGVKNQAEEQRARELIAKTAKLELLTVIDGKNPNAVTPEQALADGYQILPDYQNNENKFAVTITPVIDGSMLTDARVGYDQNNKPVINFTLNSQGGQIFGDFTAKNIGTRLAIVLDGKVYSAPVIRERIGGGSGQISGSYTPEEARDLAIALRSGALPAGVTLLEKRSVGPSLGEDSIKQGLIAFVSGAILVIVFLVGYYGIAGVFASIAVVSNIILIIPVMAFLGATLTLPGMAALVLTVGMSVDANVIINERIRELLKHGMPVKQAVKEGYDNAMSAIIDSNVTAIIASIAMYVYGTGPIKGFAVVTVIGILASMLTAIIGTHGMFDASMKIIEKNKKFKLWFGFEQKLQAKAAK